MKIFSLLATLSLLLRHAVAEDAVCRPALTDDPLCVVLLAGQHIDVGTVCLSVDDAGETMSVTYSTDDGWELDEVHLWVGDDLGDMPQTSGNRRRPGNPIPGQFPLAAEFDIPVTEYTFTIDVGGDSMLPDFSGFACPSDDESFAFAASVLVQLEKIIGTRLIAQLDCSLKEVPDRRLPERNTKPIKEVCILPVVVIVKGIIVAICCYYFRSPLICFFLQMDAHGLYL